MIESKELPNEFVSIRQVWLKQIDRCNDALCKRYMLDVKDERTEHTGQQLVVESVNALWINLIDFGEATIKSDVNAWMKKSREAARKVEETQRLTVYKSYEKLFEFIILTLNKYGMLFDSQPKGFSNVEMKSI